jgi:hypothetical protein
MVHGAAMGRSRRRKEKAGPHGWYLFLAIKKM